MPIEILMPALSPTMTEGNLTNWLKKEGDKIVAGEVIAEIETDKATMEVEAVDEGIMGKILVPSGSESVAVNTLIALLLEEGEDAAAVGSYVASDVGVKTEAKQEKIVKKEQEVFVASSNSQKIQASPLAKRVAENESVDLSKIKGTGPHGRIIKADVLENLNVAAAPKNVSGAVAFGRNPEETRLVPNSNMRKVIARRLLESKQNVPHFYLNVECQIDELLASRVAMNEFMQKNGNNVKISVNDFVIKACAMALQRVPGANASWSDQHIIYYNNVDISVAVAIDGGLITPIIKNADQKSLSVISNEMKDLAKRARENALKPEEFQGGGFSISNLGMFGIKSFNAIINPPQSCILSVGAASNKLVLDSAGAVKQITVMEISLSCDHRVVDGAIGAEFLGQLKLFIEKPYMMVL